MDAVVEAMADDFERRFRTQLFDVFNLAGLRRVWTDIGLGYVRFSDEGSNPRSLDQLRRLLLMIRPTRPTLAEVPLADLSSARSARPFFHLDQLRRLGAV
jgi:hypothetical protein